jgi:hypothetical protein
MKKITFAIATAALLSAGAIGTAAQAQVNAQVYLGAPAPPVVVVPARPVYVPPARVYYAPAPHRFYDHERARRWDEHHNYYHHDRAPDNPYRR